MRNRKTVLKSLLLILAFVVSLFAGISNTYAATGTENAIAKGGNAYANGQRSKYETIQFVSINDFHGNVESSSSNPGIAKIAGVLDQMKTEYPTFFFSAGDNFQGTAISNLTHGKVVNDAFQLMDLQASAIGNHEYDWGKDMMYDWSEEGGYPFLASNIVYKDSGEPVDYADPYMIKKVRLTSGKVVEIGIIGIATPETATKTAAANVADIEFTDPVKATKHWVKYLREVKKVDAVVALTHLGGYQDSSTGEVTGELKDYADHISGVDLIFSGHTHQTIDAVVNGIQILQGRYNGRSLQVARLTFNNRNTKLESIDGFIDPISTRIASLPVNQKVADLVAGYKADLADVLNEYVGMNAQLLEHDTTGPLGLTPLGQWTAKALSELGGTQIAIINGGGIREPMPAGEITMGTMYALFPFDNTLLTLKVTGAKLYELIEHGIEEGTFKDGQFYGVKVKVALSKPYGSRIVEMTLQNGDPIDNAALYSVSTLDFVYTGGDKYNFTGAVDVVDTFIPVRDKLAQYIRSLPGQTLIHAFDASAYVVQ
ncbi:Mannosylglucosyl-3-phosphoglycerate phosphatase [anaerobic digester metagenome]